MSDTRDDNAPELAPPSAQQAPGGPWQFFYKPYGSGDSSPGEPKKEFEGVSAHPALSPSDAPPSPSPFLDASAPEVVQERRILKRWRPGCSDSVLLLCGLVALLSAAVIGLAAGTGIEARRANNAEAQYQSLSASLAFSATATGSASPAATSAAWNLIDGGCTNNASGVTGTIYPAFSLLGSSNFTIYCNRDTPHSPMLSLFVPDIETCMDSCASWNKYIGPDFSNATIVGAAAGTNGTNGTDITSPIVNSINSTCFGVSFIPLWTSKALALKGKAPGNCYLKPGPLNETNLKQPKIGTECHAAVLTGFVALS